MNSKLHFNLADILSFCSKCWIQIWSILVFCLNFLSSLVSRRIPGKYFLLNLLLFFSLILLLWLETKSADEIFSPKNIRMGGGGLDSTMDSVLALHPVASGLILGVPKNSWCCWDLLTAQLRTEERVLIMSIESIWYRLVASYYYKNILIVFLKSFGENLL